jgi:hypothetical protein
MLRNIPTSRIVAIAIAVSSVLLAVQSGSASFRRFRDFDVNAIYIGPVCRDGVAIGIKHESLPHTLELRKVQVMAAGDKAALLGETLIYTPTYGLRDLIPNSPTEVPVDDWNPFCKAFDTERIDGENRSCGGPYYVEWDPPLTPGRQVDIYYFRNVGGAWIQVSTLASNPLPLPASDRTVEDCLVHDLTVELAQVTAAAATQQDTVLLFEVMAYDPNWPNLQSGDGITLVNLSIADQAGNELYRTTDTQAPYCAFGQEGGTICQPWNFADHDYTWPSGAPFLPGRYQLRATAYNYDGYMHTETWEVMLARTVWPRYVYAPLALREHLAPTSIPTQTPTPLPAGTPLPTGTPRPTGTPLPTGTLVPTATLPLTPPPPGLQP